MKREQFAAALADRILAAIRPQVIDLIEEALAETKEAELPPDEAEEQEKIESCAKRMRGWMRKK